MDNPFGKLDFHSKEHNLAIEKQRAQGSEARET